MSTGPDEAAVAALLASATAHQSSGDVEGAIVDLTAALDIRNRTLGPAHPDSLTLAWRVAQWRLTLGDSDALQVLREVCPTMVDVLGGEHPDTLWVQHIVAEADDPGGEPAQRLLRWVQLCGADTRVFGARHELTLKAAYGVAWARHDLGDLFGASTDAMIVHSHRRRLLGENHPDTLTAQLSKLLWRGEAQGPDTGLLDALDDVSSQLQTALGQDHPNTLLARYARAAWTPEDTTEEVEAYSEWEVLVDDLIRGRGEQDPVTLEARAKRDQARTAWRYSLEQTREIAYDVYVDMESEEREIELVPGRPWMDAGNLDDDALAEVADDADGQEAELADLMESVVAAKRALSESIRTAGNESLDVLRWRYYLAWLFWSGHEFDSARRRVVRLIDDCARLEGDDHPLTEASRILLSHIDTRTWMGVSPYWDGSALLE